MISFDCDYLEGCIPEVLERLQKTNLEQTYGYGADPYSDMAREKIKEAIGNDSARVHFLVGGTHTNATVISSILKAYQAVICATTGHINVHETGAVEHGGHKILALPSKDGKVRAADVDSVFNAYYADPSNIHVVTPGMVYISFPTELGTIYSRSELEDLHSVCRKWNIPLYIDGARLGYGLASPECDLTLKELASLCDVFYIGGTKQGALFGEAVVFTTPGLVDDFAHYIKQNGGLLAKGRLLGLQFDTLFTGDIYSSYSRHAIRLAMKVRDALKAKGIELLYASPTNQQFPVFEDTKLAELRAKGFSFEFWEKIDETHTAVRICTSWATLESNVDALIAAV
ncbi:MAG: beta-eliminating lyase-related protein [Bacteroidales bacterium]|nr:beta-eliminating lyase-related protein [Bacteroidales bacterium]